MYMKRLVLLFSLIFFAVLYSFSQDDAYYLRFAKNNEAQLLSYIFATDLDRISTGDWSITERYPDGTAKMVTYKTLMSKRTEINVNIRVIERIPVSISDDRSYGNRGGIIYSNNDLSKIFIDYYESSYQDKMPNNDALYGKYNFIKQTPLYFKDQGIDKNRHDKIKRTYENYITGLQKENAEKMKYTNFSSFYTVTALHKLYLKYQGANNRLGYFTTRVSSSESKLEYNKGDFFNVPGFEIVSTGKTSEYDAKFFKNFSRDTIIIPGIGRASNGEFYDYSVIIFPGDVLQEFIIFNKLDFDKLETGKIYLYDPQLQLKKIPEMKKLEFNTQRYEYLKDFPGIYNAVIKKSQSNLTKPAASKNKTDY